MPEIHLVGNKSRLVASLTYKLTVIVTGPWSHLKREVTLKGILCCHHTYVPLPFATSGPCTWTPSLSQGHLDSRQPPKDLPRCPKTPLTWSGRGGDGRGSLHFIASCQISTHRWKGRLQMTHRQEHTCSENVIEKSRVQVICKHVGLVSGSN